MEKKDEINFYRKVKKKRKDCLNKKIRCEVCEKLLSKKCLGTHVEREHQASESKPKIDNVKNKIVLPEKQKHDNDTSVSA